MGEGVGSQMKGNSTPPLQQRGAGKWFVVGHCRRRLGTANATVDPTPPADRGGSIIAGDKSAHFQKRGFIGSPVRKLAKKGEETGRALFSFGSSELVELDRYY